MRSDELEEALRQLLGPAAGPQGLVITLRRHDEYELLVQQITDLTKKCRQLESQFREMSFYVPLYLRALDELRIAYKLLEQRGIDTSFISSLKRR